MVVLLIIIVLCFISNSYAEKCPAKKPIVFIPGILASILEAEVDIADISQTPLQSDCDTHLNHQRLWIALKDLNPFNNDCTLGYLTPTWNSETKEQIDIEGVNIISPKFGSTYACDEIDPNFPLSIFAKCFHDLIKKFKKLGYVDGDNMVGASYDWRYYRYGEYKHKRNWFEDTKELIINTYNKYGKVVVISHSMGGLMFYKFLDYVGKEFSDKYIDNWIAMSTPFLGSGKAIAAAFPGNNLGLPVRASKLRPFARRTETVALLLPIGGTKIFGEEILMKIKSTGKTYNADQIEELIKTLDDKEFQENYLHTVQHGMKELYEKYNYKLPFPIKMHCMISSGYESIKGVEMENESYDSDSKLLYGDGDETVNLNSLEFCKNIGATTFKNLGKYTHTGILDDKASYEAVYPYVCN
ncbi:phosphatidylcholine-sterol acyltransferase precursor, putative [Entamoeba dispar SAW760]|uniref:Phosphatidylcholine-sterol acyltransferase, putative n=1 Tax=Entamoeba dispar (strain ATCC PRA-260 / SAW760) TaxID=370354 RepID=B0EN87_ENTDS|nr:phosphatidylcholine-sterol acyltransferase precursor, putative [Entamoeba dispar SAW760]EDR24031.1 phosphatidylcholine-sterol acyltransferase precursor, putative [Entamoeba dispar SAW760]|eukprot:EDR24031.1 phosphatidylcholine-sterol acyltransferase precursor, putative [Entamoeba dispar SAW760]